MASFNVKLIPEFDGSSDIRGLAGEGAVGVRSALQEPEADQKVVIPLRLKGGASAVYRQLSAEHRKDVELVKTALAVLSQIAAESASVRAVYGTSAARW